MSTIHFNIFFDLYRRHHGQFNPSLLNKIIDTAWVIFGNPYKENLDPYSPYRANLRFGLYDYFTIGIPFALASLLRHFQSKSRISRRISFIFILIEMLFRAVATAIISLIALPIILVAHIAASNYIKKIADNIIQEEKKLWISERIEEIVSRGEVCFYTGQVYGSNIISEPEVAEHLISLLNKCPSIFKLNFNYWEITEEALKKLIHNLKYITHFEASLSNSQFILLAQSNMKNLKVRSNISSYGLLTFLKQNNSVESLDCATILDSQSLENFTKIVESEGIQHPCQLKTGYYRNQESTSITQQINHFSQDFFKLKPFIETWYEFFKVANKNDGNPLTYLDSDTRRIIGQLMFNQSAKDIFYKNEKGYLKALKPNGFFFPKAQNICSKEEPMNDSKEEYSI
ncbi:MAG: hypothetical protein H0T84_02775 [Tatlockia sp.]|nr:hypothetical protein [Tatlockia sp.]